VPPHLRAGASAGSGSAPPPREPREPREAPTERWAPRQARESSSQSPSPAPPASAPKAEGSGGKWVPRWKQQQ
jgi:translation initiation factor 3 subunit A